MTLEEANRLPDHLIEKEQQLTKAKEDLRLACLDAVRAGDRLTEVLHQAKALLEENNY
jgi:hypothetical protein